MQQNWFVYILKTARGMLYTGITTDVSRRMAEHELGKRGAKSLRVKGPLELVFQLTATDRSEASVIEVRIKQLVRADKDRLIAGDPDLLARVQSACSGADSGV